MIEHGRVSLKGSSWKLECNMCAGEGMSLTGVIATKFVTDVAGLARHILLLHLRDIHGIYEPAIEIEGAASK